MEMSPPNPKAFKVHTLTELRYRGIQLWRCAPPGVEFLDLGGRHRFVGLTRGPIHGLHPQDPVLFVIAGKDHSVSFFDGVKEGPTAVQTCRGITMTTQSGTTTRREKTYVMLF